MDFQASKDRIISKLDHLKKGDPNHEIFGAENHHYHFNPPLDNQTIKSFESNHQIILPPDYRYFINQIGNGGAGPYYGLEPLENGPLMDLDHPDPNDQNDLSKPFPHSQNWNIPLDSEVEDDEEKYDKWLNTYFDKKWSTGLLRIANFGCGVTMNLVVNGPEYGNIWVEDRVNCNGIYPDPYFTQTKRLTFGEWYERWMDISLKEINLAS